MAPMTARPVGQRDRDDRFLHDRCAGHLNRVLALESVGYQQRPAGLCRLTDDPVTDRSDQFLRLIINDVCKLPAGREWDQGVLIAQPHQTADVVDERAQLVGDGEADLADVVQSIQLPCQALEHLQMGDRTNVVANRRSSRPLLRVVIEEDDAILAAGLGGHHGCFRARGKGPGIHRVFRSLGDAHRQGQMSRHVEVCRATRSEIRVARPRASPPSHDGMMMANSSPPSRHTISDPRSIDFRICATMIST